jgi:hypothetical protein
VHGVGCGSGCYPAVLIWRDRACVLTIAAIGVVVFLPLHTSTPEPEPDFSFRLVTHLAFLERWQAGREIVSTYGPWGFLFRGYVSATNPLLFTLNAALGAIAALSAWSILRPLGVLRATLFCLAALAFMAFGGPDSRYYSVVAVTLIAAYHELPRSRRALLITACALIALIKFSYFGAVTAVLAVVTAHEVLEERRPPESLAWLVAAFVGFWIAAGQNPTNIPIWIGRSADMAAGYSAGGVLPPPGGLRADVLFALAAFGLVAACAYFRRSKPSYSIGMALLFWFLFKASYVRYDDSHAVSAVAALGAIAVLTLPTLLLDPAGADLAARRLPLIAMAAFGCVLGWQTAHTRAHIAGAILRGRAALDLISYARPAATPLAGGTIDGLHNHQAVLIASQGRYLPRPVFQSYLAWTPSLARLNASHLAGPGAPRFLRIEFAPVDRHLPLMEDGPAWLEIARRYGQAGPQLLERLATPRPLRLRHAGGCDTRPDEICAAPAGGAITARIKVKESLLGRAWRIAVRGPIRTLTLRFNDGSSEAHRLTPAAGAPFLLSPVHHSAEQFLGWMDDPTSASERAVSGVSISSSAPRWFGERYAISFSRIVEK